MKRRTASLVLVASAAALACATPPRVPLPARATAHVRSANEAISQGDFDRARESLKALRSLPEDAALAETIGVLEIRLRGREVALQIQKASTLTAEPALLAVGNSVQVGLKVANPSDRVLRIRVTDGLMGRLTLLAFTFDPYGNSLRDRSVRSFELAEDLEIPAGGFWTQTSTVPVPPQEGYVLRVCSLLCEIRPESLEVGEEPVPGEPITIGPVTFRAFSEGFEKIAASPLEVLRKALEASEERFDPHVFLASALMPETDRRAAIRACFGKFSSAAGTRRRCLMASLSLLTGEPSAVLEEGRWNSWWTVHRNEYEEGGRP